MYAKQVYSKNNELSIELRCSGKDPITRRNKVYVKTFKAPPDMTKKKDIASFTAKIQLEFQEEVRKKSLGFSIAKNNIKFIDFAQQYVEDILRYNPQAFNHYRTCQDQLRTTKKMLGSYYLSEISPIILQEFCKWLCERKYDKTVTTVKASLRETIKSKNLKLKTVAQKCGIAINTLTEALTVGHTVGENSAKKICSVLGIPMEKFFQVKKEKKPYSWSANNGVKTFIHGVLQEAVRQGLIERNYASKEFLRPVTGTKGQKIILENKDEISQFVDCLKKEKDLRKKAAFACYLYLGLRNAEVAGLAWKNIYLEKQEIVISQNTIYAKGLGAVTKDTKSKNSMRILTMPQALTDILSEYKVWWEHEKTMTGDLWANTDKLFVQYNGKDMCGNTLAGWLKEWEKANGLKQVTPHGLRHTNITYQIMNDIDIKTVSARAGHADIQTTLNIYSHFVHEADRRAANKINELFDTKND